MKPWERDYQRRRSRAGGGCTHGSNRQAVLFLVILTRCVQLTWSLSSKTRWEIITLWIITMFSWLLISYWALFMFQIFRDVCCHREIMALKVYCRSEANGCQEQMSLQQIPVRERESCSVIGCIIPLRTSVYWLETLSASHLSVCRTTWMCVLSSRYLVLWVNVRSEWWGKRFPTIWAGNVNTERPAASSVWQRCLWLTCR